MEGYQFEHCGLDVEVYLNKTITQGNTRQTNATTEVDKTMSRKLAGEDVKSNKLMKQCKKLIILASC